MVDVRMQAELGLAAGVIVYTTHAGQKRLRAPDGKEGCLVRTTH